MMSSATLENSGFAKMNPYTYRSFNCKGRYWKKTSPNHNYNQRLDGNPNKYLDQQPRGGKVNGHVDGYPCTVSASKSPPKVIAILKNPSKICLENFLKMTDIEKSVDDNVDTKTDDTKTDDTKTDDTKTNDTKTDDTKTNDTNRNVKRPQHLHLARICHRDDISMSKSSPLDGGGGRVTRKSTCDNPSNCKHDSDLNASVHSSQEASSTNSPSSSGSRRQTYTSDYMLKLRKIPVSLEKPKGLPAIPGIILFKPVVSLASISLPSSLSPPSPLPSALTPTLTHHQPSFKKPSKRNRGGKLSPSSSSSSSTRLKNKTKSSQEHVRKVINLNLSGDVKLHTCEHAWKASSPAGKLISNTDEDLENLWSKLRGLLNKLSTGNFECISKQISQLRVTNEDAMKTCINVIFEKAVTEPTFSDLYAALSKKFSQWTVPTSHGHVRFITFKDLIITRCQYEFEKDKYGDDSDLSAPISETVLVDKSEENFEFLKKKRTLGNIRFIGELYMQDMLQEGVIHQCIVDLLRFGQDEDRLESLCRLLTTVGKKIEFIQSKPRIDQYFKRICDILNKKQISSRIKFMLKDILELRKNKWLPRHLCPKPVLRQNSFTGNQNGSRSSTGNIRKSLFDEKSDENKTQIYDTLPKSFSLSQKHHGRFSKFLDSGDASWHKNIPHLQNRNLNLVLSKEFSACINSLVSPTETNIQLLGSARLNGPYRTDKLAYERKNTEECHKAALHIQSPPRETNSDWTSSEMMPEQLERKCINFLNEYLCVEDMEEVRMFLDEMKEVHIKCCEILVSLCLEKNYADRSKLGNLFIFGLNNCHLSSQSFVKSLDGVLDLSDDLEIDIPKVWEYLGEILFLVFLSNSADVTTNVFKLDSSLLPKHGDKLKRLLSNVVDIVRDKKGLDEGLQFYSTVNKLNCWQIEEEKLNAQSNTTSKSGDDYKDRLEKIFHCSRENWFPVEKVLEFEKEIIESGKISKLNYVKLLIEILGCAVTSCVKSCSVDVDKLKVVCPHLKQLCDGSDEEMQLLHATQEFAHSIDHPFGVLRGFFDVFYDEDVVSEASFDKWFDSDDPNEMAGKGVAKESVSKFFEWLHQSEDDDE